MTAIALRQGLEEVTAERDDLYKARSALSARVEELETELRDARTDCTYPMASKAATNVYQ